MAPRDGPRGEARGEPALTIIASGTRVVGEVSSDGVIKVEGVVAGTVRAEHQVLVSRGGTIEGEVVTAEAVIGGTVKGPVIAERRAEVQAGSVVNGDISTGRLIVQEGGEVNGTVQMGTPAPAKRASQSDRAPSAALH